MRVSIVVIALALAGCAGGPREPDAQERAAEAQRLLRLAHQVEEPPPPFLGDPPMPGGWQWVYGNASPQVLFELGALDVDRAPEIVASVAVKWDVTPEQIAAAAMGLSMCKSDATEGVLVDLALRPSHPPEAVEALFSYYRYRGVDKPAPTTLPDAKLLECEHHPMARGRAALAHLGRVVKDPALIPVLERLAKDDDWEVRRAAALALADGPEKSPRSKDDAARCIKILKALLADPRMETHVVTATLRAFSTYDDEAAEAALVAALYMPDVDFNVRVAAIEGVGKRKIRVAADTLAKLAKSDPSTSVRYTAAEQLAEIDPAAAQKLVDGLLVDPSEYVRSAGVDVLAKSEDPAAIARLAEIAKSDPHVRVRETAVGAFEGKKDDVAKTAIRDALADKDVGIVSTACGVVAKNEWRDLLFEVVQHVPDRFPGCSGADVREAAISAISDVDISGTGHPTHGGAGGGGMRPFFVAYLHDPNPAVRAAAEKAIAKLDGKDKAAAEPRPTRGADLTGELLPGGAPIFGPNPFLVVETNKGTMKIRLFPDQAPVHCAHVAALARTHFYDGLTWHRVVPDFVIQGGCPRGDGSGNAGVTLPLEPTRIPFERGTLGMPRGDHPDTGGCQLFICHSRAPHLDVRYTAFGKVVEGFDVIDKIDVDDKILHVTVEGVR